MLEALEEALAIDLAVEGAGSPDKMQFMEVARRDGLKAALAWRDARFPGRTRTVIGVLAENSRRSEVPRSCGREHERRGGSNPAAC